MSHRDDQPPQAALDLFGRLGPQSPLLHLDPDEPVEAAVRAGLLADPGSADRLVGDLTGLIDRAGGRDERLIAGLGAGAPHPLGPVPAGSGWIDWARYVRSLVPRIAAGGAEFPPPGPASTGVPVPVPPGLFPDLPTGNRAATDVLRRHEGIARAWFADPQGQLRLHLYADLGRPVGVSGEPQLAVPAQLTGCVVLMRRDSVGGQPFVAASYPERTLPEGPREHLPDLAFLFGGYFGQDLHALDRTSWNAERALNETISPGVRGRLVDQLDRLLEQDDDALHGQVRALGSYVLPRQLRRWVTGLRRRMVELDWSSAGRPA